MKDFKLFLQENHINFEGQYIKLPSFCKRIKIDIGAGKDALHSKIWLNKDNDMMKDLVVFTFEPNPNNLKHLKDSSITSTRKLDTSLINSKVFIIPCALGNPGYNDVDVITLYEPENTEKSTLIPQRKCKKYNVPYYSLNHFEKLLHPSIIIDYVKIDSCGSDMNILLGSSNLLKRICILTFDSYYNKPEYDTDSENDSDSELNIVANNYPDIIRYLHNNNFVEEGPKLMKSFNINKTMFNKNLINYINSHIVTYYQIKIEE